MLFAFPSSSLGRLSGMPSPVPSMYSTLVALFVALFAGVYGWLAMQPEIDRPMVALGAIGKAGAFSSMLGLWALGELRAIVVVAGTGDLILGGIFTWWLLSGKLS